MALSSDEPDHCYIPSGLVLPTCSRCQSPMSQYARSTGRGAAEGKSGVADLLAGIAGALAGGLSTDLEAAFNELVRAGQALSGQEPGEWML